MKKFVLKLDLQDEKDKRKALKTISALQGVDFIAMNMKDQQLTIIGTVDPIIAVGKLRRIWPTTVIIAVGPAVEPEKKEEGKKEGEEGKKEEEKKEEGKKEDPEKEKEKKEGEVVPPVIGIMPFRQYYPPASTYYYNHQSIEENPNACVIC